MVDRLAGFVTRYFFVWTLAAGILALLHPPLFTWFRGILIPIGLGGIMLGMGITLEAADFRRVLTKPRAVISGVALQYLLMPAGGYAIGRLFGLQTAEAVGLVLVACCPGGTASNVISFLARADVGLSVTMTAFSTALSVACTPLLTELLVGGRVEVDVWGLFATTFSVVILPITAGVFLNRNAPRLSAKVQRFSPAVAVVLIMLIVGSILGASGKRLFVGGKGLRLIGAVATLHLAGFGLGFGLALLLGGNTITARTISIEVGMQNSGLAVELSRRNFSDPITALPGALSALCHCIFGSALAAYWGRSSSGVTASERS